MPEPDRTSVSAATLAAPLVPSNAPLGFAEFAQPCPAAPLFAHGHGVPVPPPNQRGLARRTRGEGRLDATKRRSCSVLHVTGTLFVEANPEPHGPVLLRYHAWWVRVEPSRPEPDPRSTPESADGGSPRPESYWERS